MRTLPIKIQRKAKTFNVEIDADKFERVAAALGMFSDEFLDSVKRAEKDVKAGRIHKLKSLKDLE